MIPKPLDRVRGRAPRQRRRRAADPSRAARLGAILMRQLRFLGMEVDDLAAIFRCSRGHVFRILRSIPPEARAMIERGEVGVIPLEELESIVRRPGDRLHRDPGPLEPVDSADRAEQRLARRREMCRQWCAGVPMDEIARQAGMSRGRVNASIAKLTERERNAIRRKVERAARSDLDVA